MQKTIKFEVKIEIPHPEEIKSVQDIIIDKLKFYEHVSEFNDEFLIESVKIID